MYSAAKCGYADTKRLEDAELTFEGLAHNRYETSVGQDIEITINLPEGKSGELSIDPFTPLPEGLELNGGVISGSVDKPVNKFIHVVLTDGNTKTATSFELLVTAIGDDAETEEYKDKKGCGGEIATASLIALISLAGLGLAFVAADRKRRIAK